MNCSYQLIIVNNKNYSDDLNNGNVFQINGSNDSWEFSAWDEGVHFVRSKNTLKEDDIFIFANDTFCFHREWNLMTRFAFVSGFKKLINRNYFVGHDNSANKKFTVLGKPVENWVSTYLFGMRYDMVNKIGSFDKASSYKEEINIQEQCIKIKNCSDTFNFHLTQWFFPKDKLKGWYNTKHVQTLILKMKIVAIMNEKLLTNSVTEHFGEVYCVYSGTLGKLCLYFNKFSTRLKLLRNRMNLACVKKQ